jgi:hypothetical protein
VRTRALAAAPPRSNTPSLHLQPGVNGGLVVLVDFITLTHRDLIVTLAAHHRLPAIFNLQVFVKSGGLVSYSINPIDLFYRAASYVDRILKGGISNELGKALPSCLVGKPLCGPPVGKGARKAKIPAVCLSCKLFLLRALSVD